MDVVGAVGTHGGRFLGCSAGEHQVHQKVRSDGLGDKHPVGDSWKVKLGQLGTSMLSSPSIIRSGYPGWRSITSGPGRLAW